MLVLRENRSNNKNKMINNTIPTLSLTHIGKIFNFGT